MIKNTYQLHSDGILSAYKDNAAVLAGSRGGRFYVDPRTGEYAAHDEDIHVLCKVETHQSPDGHSPVPGAATGAGRVKSGDRRRHRPWFQTQGRPDRLHPFRISASRLRSDLGERHDGKPGRARVRAEAS
jgi:phosphoribosylformylglycinamidine synthase